MNEDLLHFNVKKQNEIQVGMNKNDTDFIETIP